MPHHLVHQLTVVYESVKEKDYILPVCLIIERQQSTDRVLYEPYPILVWGEKNRLTRLNFTQRFIIARLRLQFTDWQSFMNPILVVWGHRTC